eukprot:CAMPEP_0194037636 /NCGR_PEP_ID=MMETSP0009_2-20130614/9976_1 /TAXON_ID=210454 /ORGANISM="Grammatophora oceanica, Strain CCMP 410" /LENGTH=974 /DNA_ID=CAMNT_0038679879 /DNA_START=117 /DNA_END=3041 /DNA_ORIENTATION=-
MQEPIKTKIVAGYALQQRLGAGSFATVYKGVRVSDQNNNSGNGNGAKEVAIKAIARTSERLTKKVLENLEMEISIMRTYRHPNIVCLQDVQKTERHFYLLLEFCGGGDLQQLIRTRKTGRLSEPLVRRLMRDLSAGLRFLWGQELIHRDIKPQNLLLTGPLPLDEVHDPAKLDIHEQMRKKVNFPSPQFALKIADFGFARHLQTASLAETLCGSPLYMAPEILQHHRYDAKADLWSVGTVLFEMIAGRPPFNGENHIDLLKNIQRKAVRLPADVRVSKECVNLLRILLNRNPLSRAGFKEFVEACDAFVALGCQGQLQPGAGDAQQQQPQRKMDLGTIHEVDPSSAAQPAYPRGAASMDTVATNAPLPTVQEPTRQTPGHPRPYAPPSGTAGYVTPPIGSMGSPPNAIVGPNRLPTQLKLPQPQPRFAPLQPSPPSSSPSYYPPKAVPPLPPLAGGVGYYGETTSSPASGKSSQHSSDESGSYVMVEHRSNSGTLSPAASAMPSNLVVSDTRRGSGSSPRHYIAPNILPTTNPPPTSVSDERFTTRLSKGMLSTSPGTGLALVGLSNRARLLQQHHQAGGNQRVETQLQSLSKMVAAAEDVGRRAISVAHLGDARAYVAMRLYVGSGTGSSLLASAPMDGVEEENDETRSSASVTDCESSQATDVAGRRRSVSVTDRSMSSAKQEEDDENEEMPFAVPDDTPKKKNTSIAAMPSREGSSASSSIYRRSSLMKSKALKAASPEMIRSSFSEALSCYVKALSMLKSVLTAIQKVKSDISSLAAGPVTQEQERAIQSLTKRFDVTSNWLTGQFTGVLERADAANTEIQKLQTQKTTENTESNAQVTRVEELIYNHSLACGRDGAVKQLLGQYDAARSCYRSAGLLAETLLMDPNVETDDRKVLEGFVDGFAARITELDGLMLQQSRSVASSPGGSSYGMSKRGSSGVVPLIGGIPPPRAGFDAVSTAFRFSSSASQM